MNLSNLLSKALLFAACLLLQPFHSLTAPADSQAAFAKLQSLAGTWEGTGSDGSKSRVQYEVIAGNSAVVERFVNDKMGAGNAMVTVYYLDGGRLLLQHYCMAKNQPRMKAESFDATGNELRFEFLDATGLPNPQAGHMHNATIHFIDANHISQEWQFFENGKQKFAESLQYTRVR
jgi:hypothetical protein